MSGGSPYAWRVWLALEHKGMPYELKLLSFDALSTHVDIEVTPFVDAGRVFGRSGTVPFTQLHPVGGIGFRGIARPFVVGYVDVGYGSEGSAVFTGIGYPF